MPRALRLAIALIICGLSLAACAAVGGPDIKFARKADLSPTFERLTTAMAHYLALPADLFQTDPEAFFTEGKVRLDAVDEANKDWRELADEAPFPKTAKDGVPSRETVDGFNQAIDAWLEGQREQAANSHDCWVSIDREACYARMVQANTAAWEKTGVDVRAAAAQLQSETGSR